jgi:cytoskeletal protein CcmA (bactofilin family)
VNGSVDTEGDLVIEGTVNGDITVLNGVLTIGAGAQVFGKVQASGVIVRGTLKGPVSAGDRISIEENGSVEGDICAPRIAIAELAHFHGSVDMQSSRIAKREDKDRRSSHGPFDANQVSAR